MKKSLLFIILLLSYTASNAQLKVASVFSDYMVIQRDGNVAVWGTANPNTDITVSFDSQVKVIQSNTEGDWKLYLDALSANNVGQELIVTDGIESITFEDVLIGDVWIAGGQSNMNVRVKSMGSINADIISKSENNLIRFLNVSNRVSATPQTTLDSEWVVSNEINIKNSTAIGAIFAQEIQPELNIPIGILDVNLGSTSVECWVSKEMLLEVPFYETYKFWEDLEADWDNGGYEPFLVKEQKKDPTITKETMITVSETRTYPSGAYNAMLTPLFPFSVKGVIWRQGEANSGRAQQYSSFFIDMADLWRDKFENNDLPFVLIGLPSYGSAGDKMKSPVAEIRESQRIIAGGDNNMYYVSILDLNDGKDGKYNIHPKNKYLAGIRSGKLALDKIYNIGGQVYSSYKSKTIVDNKITVELDNVGAGLFTGTLMDLKGENITPNIEPVNNFWICAADGVFVRANANIVSNNTIEVWSDIIPNPINIRYGWENVVLDVNLYNGLSLPIPTFRTDDYTLSTEGKVKPRIDLVRASPASPPLSFGEDEILMKTSFYPNPFKDVINLNFSHSGKYEIQILDISGHEIYKTTVNGYNSSVDLRNIKNKGVYLLRISKNGNSNIYKIVKE